MKHLYIHEIYGAFMLLLCSSCASEGQEECLPCQKVRAVDVRLTEVLSESGLETPLYLFRRRAGSQDDYTFDRSYGSVTDGQTLKMPLSELEVSDYRFLMVAQPGGGKWLTLQTAAGTPFAPGAAWEDLRLVSTSGRAAIDGYCGFTDRSGEEVLADGSIQLSLTRIAGQVLFDFFRTGGSLSQPEGVVSDDVESVLDRVTRIDIEYGSPTSSLRFGADGRLTAAAYASESLMQIILPDTVDFKVPLPQEEKGLDVYDTELRGSLRIGGAFLLPSDSTLRVRMTFIYYDTTPSCSNNHTGEHTAGCYPQRQMVLNLPSAASLPGLPVAADCFTVNRAGLRCDRIIDVPVSGTIDTDFDWM